MSRQAIHRADRCEHSQFRFVQSGPAFKILQRDIRLNIAFSNHSFSAGLAQGAHYSQSKANRVIRLDVAIPTRTLDAYRAKSHAVPLSILYQSR